MTRQALSLLLAKNNLTGVNVVTESGKLLGQIAKRLYTP